MPKISQNFSGYNCHLIFEKLIIIAIEKGIGTKDDIIAKSSENYISVKIGC